jgi:two-component system, OmpR family, sensor histidine kinase TctE
LGVLIAINSFSAYRNATDAANTAYDRSLLAAARVIAERVDLHAGKVVVEVPYVALDFIESDVRGRIYYRVSGLKGEPVSGYDDLPPMPPNIGRSEEYSTLARFYLDRFRGDTVRVAALYQPVQEGELRGMALIQVAETLDSREAVIKRIMLDTIYRQLLLVMLTVAVVFFVVRRALRPLDRLRGDVEARKAGDLSRIDAAGVPSEVRPFVDGINQYVGRLRTLLSGQERFVADASHQLRTPLAVMKMQTELALREADPARREETIEALHRAVSEAIHLANQLLSRARMENSIAARAFAEADLVPLARQVCLELAPFAVAKRIELEVDAEGRHAVTGDATLLHELIKNLVDNAIRYTPEEGRVRVRLHGAPGQTIFEVEDTGEGIAESDRERVFEPFARVTQGPEPGCGLGLAIVADIVRAHGASVVLEHARPNAAEPGQEPGKGLRVIVRFEACGA